MDVLKMCPNCGSSAVEEVSNTADGWIWECVDCEYVFEMESGFQMHSADDSPEDDPDFEGYPGHGGFY